MAHTLTEEKEQYQSHYTEASFEKARWILQFCSSLACLQTRASVASSSFSKSKRACFLPLDSKILEFINNVTMWWQMCSDIFLCDICWQARDTDHFGWCTAIVIVLGSIAVETVQRWGGKINLLCLEMGWFVHAWRSYRPSVSETRLHPGIQWASMGSNENFSKTPKKFSAERFHFSSHHLPKHPHHKHNYSVLNAPRD